MLTEQQCAELCHSAIDRAMAEEISVLPNNIEELSYKQYTGMDGVVIRTMNMEITHGLFFVQRILTIINNAKTMSVL